MLFVKSRYRRMRFEIAYYYKNEGNYRYEP